MKDVAGWATLPKHTRQRNAHYFPAGATEGLCRKAYLHDEATPRLEKPEGPACPACEKKLETPVKPRNERRACVACLSYGMTERETATTPLLALDYPPLCRECMRTHRVVDGNVECPTCKQIVWKEPEEDSESPYGLPHDIDCATMKRPCPRCRRRPTREGRLDCGPCTTETLREVHRQADREDPPQRKRGFAPRWDAGSGGWDDAVRRLEER